MWCCSKSAAIWGTPAVALTHSGRQPVTRSGPAPHAALALKHSRPSCACHRDVLLSASRPQGVMRIEPAGFRSGYCGTARFATAFVGAGEASPGWLSRVGEFDGGLGGTDPSESVA
jgi:hypothetical protein